MSQGDALSAYVDGIGLLAPGLTGWAQAAALLRGQAPYQPAATALPAPEILPPAERRRASRIVKTALAVGLEAVRQAGRDAAPLPAGFASSGGAGASCDALCELLAGADRQISPTRFHNSVHNAASGYWSIATGATPAGQVVCAHDASAALGLLEALVQIGQGEQALLLVAADTEYPAPLHATRPVSDASGIALVLTAQASEHSLARLALPRRGYWSTDPASTVPEAARVWAGQNLPPFSLWPLLHAVATGQRASLALAALPGQALRVEVGPV